MEGAFCWKKKKNEKVTAVTGITASMATSHSRRPQPPFAATHPFANEYLNPVAIITTSRQFNTIIGVNGLFEIMKIVDIIYRYIGNPRALSVHKFSRKLRA